MNNELFIEKLRKSYDNFGIIKLSQLSSTPINELIELLDLDFKTFNDLEFRQHGFYPNGVQAKIKFDNGYGASIVRTPTTYGGDKGLYELAVLGKDGRLNYDTPITFDVIGYLTPKEVTDFLIQIQDLK